MYYTEKQISNVILTVKDIPNINDMQGNETAKFIEIGQVE
jgi:hypothetical protein